MEYKNLKFERQDTIGVLTLNRPDKLNAISVELAHELVHFFTNLQDDLQTKYTGGTVLHLFLGECQNWLSWVENPSCPHW